MSNEKKEKKANDEKQESSAASQDVDYYKFYDFDNENLNKLEEGDLKKRKNEMDVLYNKNAILPGQEGYEFDVRKEYNMLDDEDGNINFF